MAGLEKVPCIVKEMSDHEAMEAVLTENLQRESLTDYEVGRWFKLLMEKFPDKYPDLKAVAERFGYKDHTAVSRLISHYEFLEKVKEKLPPNAVPRGTMLPEGFIREVRRAPEEIQPKILKAIVNAQLKCERVTQKATSTQPTQLGAGYTETVMRIIGNPIILLLLIALTIWLATYVLRRKP